jgi:hypothetical protein
MAVAAGHGKRKMTVGLLWHVPHSRDLGIGK